MLSHADAALVARDPAITGLAVILDEAAFAAVLRLALPGVSIDAVEATYVRYKPGTSCLVAYTLATADGPVSIYALAYAPVARTKLRRAAALRERPGPLGVGGLAIAELDMAVYSWPYDHELPAMALLDWPRGRGRLLAALAPNRLDLYGALLTSLRHKPERRYVGRLCAGGGDALLKLYGADDYQQARRGAAAFASAGPLRVVAPLGVADAHRAMLFPWQQDSPLAAMLWGDAGAPAAVRLTGAALAALHAQPGASLPRRDARLTDELAAAARAVAVLYPQLGARAWLLASELSAALGTEPATIAPIHGDFYADQVLVGAGQATILDFDNAHRGDPAADLGSFAAHLQGAAVAGHGDTGAAGLLREALLAGYASGATPPPEERIWLHTAAALLRLAPEPFRRRVPLWHQQLAQLVAAAEQAFAGQARAVAAH